MDTEHRTPRDSARLRSPDGVVHYVYSMPWHEQKITWCEVIGDGFEEIDSWTTDELETIRRNTRVTCLLCLAVEEHEPSED